MASFMHADNEIHDQTTRKVSMVSSDHDLNEEFGNTNIVKDSSVVSQLLTHIPDMVINYNQKVSMPAKKECIGVAMFADISGFTALCEKYADMVKIDSACGTDKLTATLNSYIGKIVDCIIKDGGDVLKFAGDALLASWLFSHSGHNVKTVLTKAICCGLAIQEKCDNQMTEVGILLRVKIAMAVGSMIVTFVGTHESKQFTLSGTAIEEVGAAEKHAEPSDVILTHLAWINCDQDIFKAERLPNANVYKVSENKRLIESQSLGLVDVLPGVLAGIKDNSFTCKKEKVIICPRLDKLIAECPACNLGLPKALLPDTDDIDTPTGFAGAAISARSERRFDKEKRFDRRRMSFTLTENQVEDLRAYVATPVLDKLDHGQDVEWLSEMREVSVLFINMKLPGGTDDPARALQRAYEIIHEETLKYQGNLNKVFSFDKGCTFIVIFGLPGGKHEDDGYRSIVAGQGILESLQSIAGISDETIGVTTGRAFCGVVGHKDRHEYTVIGRKVNMAARLMTNYPGKLSCDPETFDVAKMKLPRSDFSVLPFKVLKGIKDPGIIREYYPSSRIEEEVQDFYYPIIGREKEIDQFIEILDNSQIRGEISTSILLIEGDAGIGKSRLLEELMEVAEDKRCRQIWLELNSSQTTMPHYTISGFVSFLLNLEDCVSSQDREELLYEIVENEIMREKLWLLNDLFGTELFPDANIYQMEEDKRIAQLQDILFHIIKLITDKIPVVFFVDNAQYIDAESWEFFQKYFIRLHAILVLAMRPFSTTDQVPCPAAVYVLAHFRTKRIELESLPDDLMSDVACQMLQACCIPKKLDVVLRSGCNGVPSRCEQLVKELLFTNVLQTGPPSAFDLENEIQTKSSNLDASLSTMLLPGYQRGKSGGVRRSRSMIRQKFKILKSASSIFPSLTACNMASNDAFKLKKSNDLIGNGQADSQISINSGSRSRRVSLEPENSIILHIERTDSLYPIAEHTYDASEEVITPVVHDAPVPKAKHLVTSRRLSFSPRIVCNYVCASPFAVPNDIKNVCIITEGRDINDSIDPNAGNDVFIARFDRMSPNEQLILKCASVLGMNFTRELLCAIVPRKTASVLDITLYKLSKEKLLECGSLILCQSQQYSKSNSGYVSDSDLSNRSSYNHHIQDHKPKHQVLCGCYANEGSPTINLSQIVRQSGGKKKHCLYFHFTDTSIQEAAYDLWLEEQRLALHERAAIFLESQRHMCKPCGGASFVPGRKSKTIYHRNVSIREMGDVSANVERKIARVHSRSSSMEYQKEGLMRKAIRGSRVSANKDEIANDVGYYQKRKETKKGELVGKALIDLAGMLSSGGIKGDKSEGKIRSLTRKILSRKHKVSPDTETAFRTAVAELQKMIAAPDRSKQPDNSRRISHGSNQNASRFRGIRVNASECQCNQVLSIIYPQLVFHWKASKNKLKAFTYMIESAAALIAVHSNIQALSHLTEVQTMISESEDNCNDDSMFFIGAEDKARAESLAGQALMSLSRTDEAIEHFMQALKYLGNSHPNARVGIWFRTLSAYMTQVLHRKMPNTFKERNEESSVLLVEEARCLTHLVRAYKTKGDFPKAYMVSLEQLNAADEGSEDFVELMNAYSNVIECCQLTSRKKLAYTYEELALEKMKQEFKSVHELLAAVALYTNIMSFRLYRGKVISSISAGYEALQLANNINDLRAKIEVIPLLSQALLLISRVHACREVLHELRKAALDLENIHGKVVYYCGCMDLILEHGRPMDSFKKCLEFCNKIVYEPSLSYDILPRFYLPASVSVMLARQNRWPLALSFYKTALEFEQEHPDSYFYCRAYARLAEFNLLRFRENRREESIKLQCRAVLKKFKLLAEKHCVLCPRLYHLQAYYAYLRGKNSRSKLLIDNCLIASRSIGPMFEEGWVTSSRNHWFSTDKLPILEVEYEGKSIYTLPRY